MAQNNDLGFTWIQKEKITAHPSFKSLVNLLIVTRLNKASN